MKRKCHGENINVKLFSLLLSLEVDLSGASELLVKEGGEGQVLQLQRSGKNLVNDSDVVPLDPLLLNEYEESAGLQQLFCFLL